MIAISIQEKFISLFYKTKIVVAVSLIVFLLLSLQLSVNQLTAIVLGSVVITFWFFNRVYGLTFAVIFFMIKPVFLRAAYSADRYYNNTQSFDLLSITPALIIMTLVISQMYVMLVDNEKFCADRTRKLLVAFSSLAFISIFFPTNSIFVGLSGFERNILPNMLILFLSFSVFKTEKDVRFLLKTFLLVGLISVVYGIGQYIVGIYPWEIKWFHEVGFANSTAGWLSIGLRGIEFRIFSIFYYRTDFFFTNVLIFTFLYAYGKSFNGIFKFGKYLYYFLWFVLMIITFERTPFIMTFVAVAIIYFMNASKARKKILLISAAVITFVGYSTLLVFEPYLKSSGVESLIRLAEMTNPLEAGSIHDRADNYWGPSLEIISSNPIGVGIGHGSGTKASNKLNLADTGNIHTHNEILQKTLEMGLVGGILFILLIASVVRDALKLSKTEGESRKFGIGMTAGTLVFMMSSLITLTFSGGRGLTFWMLAGISLSLFYRFKSNNDEKESIPCR